MKKLEPVRSCCRPAFGPSENVRSQFVHGDSTARCALDVAATLGRNPGFPENPLRHNPLRNGRTQLCRKLGLRFLRRFEIGLQVHNGKQ